MTFLGYLRKHAPDQDVEILREAFDIINKSVRMIRNESASRAIIQFKVGDSVWFDAGRRGKIVGTVRQVNRTTVGVIPTNGTRDWRVNANILNKMKKAKAK